MIPVLSGSSAIQDLGKNDKYALLHEIYAIPSISNYTGNDPNVGLKVYMKCICRYPFPEIFKDKSLKIRSVKIICKLISPYIDDQPNHQKIYNLNPNYGPYHGTIALPAYNDTSSKAIKRWNVINYTQYIGILPFTASDIVEAYKEHNQHMVIQQLPNGNYPCTYHALSNLSRKQFLKLWIWNQIPAKSQNILGDYIYKQKDFLYKTFVYNKLTLSKITKENWVRWNKEDRKPKHHYTWMNKKAQMIMDIHKQNNNKQYQKNKPPKLIQVIKQGQVSKFTDSELQTIKARLAGISQIVANWGSYYCYDAMIITQKEMENVPINNVSDTKSLMKKLIHEPDQCQNGVFGGQISYYAKLKPLSDNIKQAMNKNGTKEDTLINFLIEMVDHDIASKQSKEIND